MNNQTTSSPKEQLHPTAPVQNIKQTEPAQDNLPPTKADNSPEDSKTPSTTSSEDSVSQEYQPTQAPSINSEKKQPKETQTPPVSETPQQVQVDKTETQPQLTDAQKLAQVQQILGNLESKFISLQAESNSITLTAAELASLDQASNLLQQSPVSLSTADQRALLINDKDARKDYIKELKRKIKDERNAGDDLNIIAKLEEELARVSNHNNYNLNVMNSLSGINSVLQNGTYLDSTFQIPREQKFALELIKKRNLLRS